MTKTTNDFLQISCKDFYKNLTSKEPNKILVASPKICWFESICNHNKNKETIQIPRWNCYNT